MSKAIKIILPSGMSPEDLKDLLVKSYPTPPPQSSFQDPVIEAISAQLFLDFETMYEELLSEVSYLLESEYGDLL